MNKEKVYVSGSNYFNEADLQEMIKELDNGKIVEVGIDCIGHTRNNMEQDNYKEALRKHYGIRLVYQCTIGVCTYSYSYWLKEVE